MATETREPFQNLVLHDLRNWLNRKPGDPEFQISPEIDRDFELFNPIVQEYFSGVRDLLVRVADGEPGDDPEQDAQIVELLAMFNL